MKWLRRVWASMTWEPEWPAHALKGPVRVYQELLDCTRIVRDDG